MPGKREKEGEELKSSFNRSVEKIPISLHKKVFFENFPPKYRTKNLFIQEGKKKKEIECPFFHINTLFFIDAFSQRLNVV